MPGLLGRKIGVTSVFSVEGVNMPCTIIEVGPCVVTQVKTADHDGYEAIRLGFQSAKGKRMTRPLRGYFEAAGVINKRHLTEFMSFGSDYRLGDETTVELFSDTHCVDVHGTSEGKGFQGVAKRHGFGGVGQSTRGRDDRLRAPGTVGACSYPTRVFKGTHMAGQMGNKRVAVQSLRVIKIMSEHSILVLKGNVPGAKGSVIAIER